jgi:tRNA dimethylallyltransferase
MEPVKKIVLLVGPTAVGKTETSIELAYRLGGEIVSVDSRLLYRGLDIGTAKPTPEERKKIPHHLIDVVDPDETWSLAVFQKEANKVIEEILERGRLPVLVGGTGQYVRAITEGWLPPEVMPDPQLRKALEDWLGQIGGDELHRRLAVIDGTAARLIDPRNQRRTIRALEVIFTTGRKFSEQRMKKTSPYKFMIVGLTRPRQELYQRVDERIDYMITAGLVEEVKGLLERGYSPDLPSLSAIGYREIVSYLQNKITLEEAILLIKRSTRQFVRRQANWFKLEDPTIHWYTAGSGVVDQIEAFILSWLDQPNGI